MAGKTLLDLGPYLWLAGSLVLVVTLAGSLSLRRTIWHARVPVAFAVLACVALAGPQQTRFLVAGIDSLVGGVALLLAVLLTGIGAWFWARWSLNLAWQAALPGIAEVCDSFWWRWIPRIVAVAPAAAALLCLGFGVRMMSLAASIPLGLGLLTVAGMLIALAWARRSHIRGRRMRHPPQVDRFAWFLADEALVQRLPARPHGLRAWLALARACMPFDFRVTLPLFAAFLILVAAVQAGATWPSALAQAVGAAPTALIGLAAMLTLLAPTIGLVLAATRWPAMFFLALLIVGAASVTVNTIVREAPLAPPERPELKAAASAWLQRCAVREPNGVIRSIVVANAGGASRAALWTGAVMQALETGLPGMQPGRHLFAISGISGGALGAAAYVATLDQHGVACGGTQDAAQRDERLGRLRSGLGEDFLAPPLAGLFLGDGIWRVFGPISAAAGSLGWWPTDRSVRLERAWEAAFSRPGTTGMDAPFVTRSLDAGAPRLPLLLTGGTHQETGRLAVTAPVDVRRALPEVIDIIATLGADLPFSVAASNSARFPYVTAPGLLQHGEGGAVRRFGQIVDGGYYDNHGSVAARAAAEALAQAHDELLKAGQLAGTRLRLFVVQVLSDPELPLAELPRCTVGPGQQPEVEAVTAPEGRPSSLDFLTSPVGALAAVRGERANGGALEMARRYCGGDSDFAVFSLGVAADGIMPPLSWVLSRRVRDAIAMPGLAGFDAGYRDTPGQGNAEELRRLAEAWTRAAAP